MAWVKRDKMKYQPQHKKLIPPCNHRKRNPADETRLAVCNTSNRGTKGGNGPRDDLWIALTVVQSGMCIASQDPRCFTTNSPGSALPSPARDAKAWFSTGINEHEKSIPRENNPPFVVILQNYKRLV
ncbi:hypothetical protein SADUNF_Sadunf03G0057800 [Salix dunnii]|uniref:Uncharacterized protein n=1 Tax=Salix dunnii TaxID=1413687 RepID=A0A835KH93_9ROSI|nr:hypothetical protein SADUNF_Sadunf03G0057800 [Salix dunnii]